MNELINQSNLGEMMLNHTKSRPTDCVMIRQPGSYSDAMEARIGEQAAEMWFVYLSSKGLRRTLKFWKSLLRPGSKTPVQVPCANPAIFDTSWKPVTRSMLNLKGSFFEQPSTPPDAAAFERMRQAARDIRIINIPTMEAMREII